MEPKQDKTIPVPETLHLTPDKMVFPDPVSVRSSNINDDGTFLSGKEAIPTSADIPKDALDYFRMVNGVVYVYDKQNATWITLGGGGGLVTSGTYSADTTISGLSGTNAMYRLVIYTKGTTNFDTGLQINGDTAANYDWFHHIGYNNAGGGNLTSYNAQIGATAIQLNNYSSNYMYMTIDFSAAPGYQRLINYQLMTKKDANNYETVSGSAVYYNGTDISSLTITHLGGTNPTNGFYWLYKLTG